MAETSKIVQCPSLDQVYEINHRMVEEFGGLFTPPHNLLNPGSLQYALAMLSSSMSFSPNRSLIEKAAALAYHIMTRHIFSDGNKRTGLFVAWEYLRINGVRVNLEGSDSVVVEVAAGRAGIEDLATWFRGHTQF